MTWPILTIGILSLVTILLLQPAMTFEQNMTRDIEVYLPEGEESTNILIEVREDWATDLIIVYVETPNAKEPQFYDDIEKDNITYVPTLLEIALLEKTIDPYGQNVELEDEWQADRGVKDDIIFTLSISTLIKEFNSTNARFIEASEKKIFGGLSVEESDDDLVNETGTYEIPNYSDQERSQERVDQIYDSTSSALQNFAIDTNNDGIIDTAVILFALKAADENNDEVQKQKIIEIQNHIDQRANPKTEMTQTGLVVVLHEVTDRLYQDLLTMLPMSLGIVVALMLIFHRNWLAIPVVLVPIFCALIWTLGIVSLSPIVLTPMIVAAGPILVGIGVDYGLHVANRIVEFKDEGNKMPKATYLALLTTGKATLLCAITDSIGFSALFISPIIPMRTVGFTMIVGVICAFFLTVSMTPAIMKLTNYSRHKNEGWKKIAILSTKQWKAILLVVLLTTAYSIARISVLDQDMRGDESAPEDVDSIQKLSEYSEKFEAGQTGILLINNETERDKPAAKDLDVLDIMNWTQGEINNITIENRNTGKDVNVSAFSIVDFFKSAHITITIEDLGGDALFEFDGSFWDFLHSDFFGSDYAAVDVVYSRESLRSDMIDVFYESFTDEMRAMLLTDEYDKALIYVSMPYVNIDDTTIIVNDIDKIAEVRDRQMSFENAQMSQLTGGPPVTIAINEGIQETQFDTIKLSLLLVLIAMICVFWSVKYGFITFLPILLVILWYPATVDAGGTNLNIFTAMVGTIIIGIGIDNSIQISERVREEGATPEGIQKAVENTGQSVVEATFTTMGGVFSGVIISFYRTQFVGLRNFFALIITLVLFSLLMAVFALPSFYHAWHYLQNKYAKRNWRIKTKFN
uniref:Transport protein n=1 Tax=uncultured marine group II/III euryarchaeote KM3_147_B09 TaxID=1457882 RepID=A0A075GCT2_9EURY|nr:transport protein [uncultured marine group II/III euryarchaeote KM3_147_B09]